MLAFHQPGSRVSGAVTRREWLRVGGLGVVGLSLTDLLAARNVAHSATKDNPLADGLSGTMFGAAKNVIFLWLQGGPPQHETFDPKPEAPLEIRGPFQSIQTNVPGIDFCELLPRTAQRADKLAVIRSLSTDDNNHDVSGYWVLTGYPYGPGSARQIKPTDWPYLGSVIKMLKPSERLPALSSVWLPDLMRLNDNVTPAGQTGGFLGSMWDPERFVGDPAADHYRIEGLSLPLDLPIPRMSGRTQLLDQLDRHARQIDQRVQAGQWDKLSTLAMDLVLSGKARAAFDLSQEPPALRDRYGRHTWGQSCLLARRLVEAGVRLVHVNWMREAGDNAVDNPMWDTHTQNADRLQDYLCPVFDVSYSALLDDLEQRGLMSETLVVVVGEFGRTPKINRQGGRDHWGPVFSATLAGAGISGGQVFGASDKNGAYPSVDAIRPHDLTATIYHLLGIPHDSTFRDLTNRTHPVTKGEPLYRLIGDRPATMARCESTGDARLVPPYDPSPLVDTEFATGLLYPATTPTKLKGWRASPLIDSLPNGLVATRVSNPQPHVRLGALEFAGSSKQVVAAGSKLMLGQEVRNARGGTYTFTIRVSGQATSPAEFERWFGNTLACRLVLFRFANMNKSILEIEELASERFLPELGSFNDAKEFTVTRFLGATIPGTNFSTGNGLGVALIVEALSNLELRPSESASLNVDCVKFHFDARKRDDNVTV